MSDAFFYSLFVFSSSLFVSIFQDSLRLRLSLYTRQCSRHSSLMNMVVAVYPFLDRQIVVFPLRLFVTSRRFSSFFLGIRLLPWCPLCFPRLTRAFTILYCSLSSASLLRVTHVSLCHIAYSSVVRKLRTSSVAEYIIIRRLDVCVLQRSSKTEERLLYGNQRG